MRRVFLLISTCTAAILVMGCKGGGERAAMPPLRIECAEATTKKLNDKITFTTSTAPIRSVTIEPRVNGYLESVNFSSGEMVSCGDVIFLIDPTQIATKLYAAEAELQSANAALRNAYNNYQRATPLARINAISASSLDEYVATYLAAEAEVKSAEQSLKDAELNLTYTRIKAPMEGLIADSPAVEGDYVGPATKFETLTTITQIDTMIVSLAIPTSRYIRYMEGASYNNEALLSDMTLRLSNGAEYPHKAIYDYTEQSASSGNSTVVIVAKVPNPDAQLKANMFARVTANIGAQSERVVVPQSAVTQMQGVSSVWVVRPDSTLSFRVVRLGNTYGEDWQITSGVEAGEVVATSGQLKLHQGAKVIPTIAKR